MSEVLLYLTPDQRPCTTTNDRFRANKILKRFKDFCLKDKAKILP
jgi:hypothetical protein